MNVITYFQELADKWQKEKKCSSCWTFGAPLSESAMNASEPSEETKCCNHLYVTDYETSAGYEKSQSTGFVKRAWTDHIFTLYLVKQATLGVNTYNEQLGHPIEESYWKTILEPLQQCIGNGNEFDLCEMGYEFEIFKWNMKVVKLKHDHNYTGWRILGIFRQYTQ